MGPNAYTDLRDSYFAISGLLIGGLTETVNNTLQNYLDSIENFGFIPNGGRIYYRNRSYVMWLRLKLPWPILLKFL